MNSVNLYKNYRDDLENLVFGVHALGMKKTMIVFGGEGVKWVLATVGVGFFLGMILLGPTYDVTTRKRNPAMLSNQLPDCSNDFFREFIKKHHRYPNDIQWNANYTDFSPLSCHIRLQNIKQCLKRKQIQKIALYGASQVHRYGLQLAETFKRAGFDCKKTKEERRKPIHRIDRDYFAAGNKSLRSKMMIGSEYVCSGCSSYQIVCKSNDFNGDVVHIEFISTENVNTTTLILKNTTVPPTYEHFIFDVYLGKSFPDLNVFFLPMNHIKRHPVERFVREFPATLLPLVKRVKPPKAEFFFIPGTSEFEESRSAKSRDYKNKLWYGLLATDAIRKLNSVLFSFLESDIMNLNSKISSFLDLTEVTASLGHLCKDGSHFDNQWYYTFWKVFLNVYCHED
ncbi:hypothetical protein CAPTEDRAFT_201810 [Capitella teleta]|uniref:Uncharacterized protein n=1 Tax=Capitella teleta TaxID=283909 RepID=R7U5A6_CAPTE|nr:hypothetical protein CAPTEDRAFT_201810 [Capitella teleta]|eukprot:ELU01550.1 hypothetical protein CAPTEDRAFT_201810 [Capitella teleta]